MDELEFLLERPVEAVVAPAERVAALLRRHRGGEVLLEQASEGLRLQFVDDDEEDVDLKTLPAESPIVRLVDSLVLGAIDRRASDIHVETKDREVLVKYRIDGVLYPAVEPLDKKHHETIISRLKVMSELDIAEKRVPQDGRFRLRVKGRTIDFRVSIMPSIHGEDAVIRVLDKEQLNEAFRQAAPRRPRLLRVRPPAAPQVHRRALRDGGGDRPHRQRQDHDALRRASARSPPPRTRSSPSRTRSSTRSPASSRCRSTRRRG